MKSYMYATCGRFWSCSPPQTSSVPAPSRWTSSCRTRRFLTTRSCPGIAHALVSGRKLPVVRLDHAGFDHLIVALWARLFPEIRRAFAFRLSFDPRDLVDEPAPAVVCTPKSMSSRWSDYPVVSSVALAGPLSPAAALLTDRPEAAPFLHFLQQTEATPATFRELQLFEQAFRLNTAEQTFGGRIAAVRLINTLSPHSHAGRDLKDVLLGEVCSLMPTASATDILALRNLDVAAFPTAHRLWDTLKAWAAGNAYAQDQDSIILSILKSATTNAAVEPWRIAGSGRPHSRHPRP